MKKKTKRSASEDVSDVTVPTVINSVASKQSNLKGKKKKIRVIKQVHAEEQVPFAGTVQLPAGKTLGKQAPIETLIGTEIGDSGVRNIGGIIQEDYNPALNGIQGIKIYDEMRRSDGTVRAILLATSLPIRKAKWRVEAASEDPQDQEIADFVQRNLFDIMKTPWNDFMRQALQMLAFGVMPFEKIYAPMDIDGKTMIVLHDLKQRMPKTIYRWMLNDGSLGIQQQRQDGILAEIPMSKMLVFVNEKEGDNWWGMSVLRAAYKHWFIKNTIYRIDAIGIERQSVGVPFIKLPVGATDSDKKQAQIILQNLRANEAAYAIIPNSYEMGFLDMMSNSTRETEPSINHHNREITKSVLAQFLELGSQQKGGSGGASKALSQDHSQLFMLGLEAIAEGVKDTINKYLVPQLVDLNFNVEKYPTLDYAGISETDVQQLSTAYSAFVTSGAIKPIDNDEMYLRDLLDLPEITQEEIDERELQEQDNQANGLNPDGTPKEIPAPELQDDNEVTIPNKGKKPEIKKPTKNNSGGGSDVKESGLPSFNNMSELYETFKKKRKFDSIEMKSRVETQLAKMTTANKMVFLNKNIKALDKMSPNLFFSELKAILTEKQADLHALIFRENNDFKGWRPLTFAEQKVDLYGMNEMMDKLEGEFQSKATDYLQAIKTEYVRRLSQMLHDGDINGIRALDLQMQEDYKNIVRDTLKAAVTYGKNNASREMGVDTPPDPATLASILDLTADNIAKDHFQELATEARTIVTEQIAKDVSAAQIAAMVDKNLDDTIDYMVGNTADIIIGGNINQGRNIVFDESLDDIYAKQRSEILDFHTCTYCLSMDGRIVTKDDPFGDNTIFHSGCRGIWVAILMDESDKPAITGIPNSLRDAYGGSINDLKQPKKAIVRKGSPAEEATQMN